MTGSKGTGLNRQETEAALEQEATSAKAGKAAPSAGGRRPTIAPSARAISWSTPATQPPGRGRIGVSATPLPSRRGKQASALRARCAAGRWTRPALAASEPRLGLRSGDQPFPDRRLSRGFARPAHRFRLLAGFALRRLLIGFALLHLAENAFALHLLFEHPQGLVDVVVANEYRHCMDPSVRC
jgi:hypothetical protein